MLTRIFVLTMGLAGVVACGGGGPEPPADQPRHPLLDNLQPPPLNRPVVDVPIPTAAPSLPPGDRPALLLVSQGRRFHGTATLAGRVVASKGRVEFTSPDRPPLQILYRLPAGLRALPDVDAKGSVTLLERTNPGGPNRQVLIRTDGALLLAHVWLTSPKPLAVTLDEAAGLRLVQLPVRRATPDGLLADAQVEVFDGDLRAGAAANRVLTPIRARTGSFQAFVETSRLAYASGRTDQRDGRYILEAWVVRSPE